MDFSAEIEKKLALPLPFCSVEALDVLIDAQAH